MHQSEDLIDFLEAWDTDNKYQFVGHFDQSVAHNKKNVHALVCFLGYMFSPYDLHPPPAHLILPVVCHTRLQRKSTCHGAGENLYCAIALFLMIVWVSLMFLQ